MLFPPIMFPFLFFKYGREILQAYKVGLFALPFAYLGAVIFGYEGIVGAALAANLLAIWGALVVCQAVGLIDLDAPPVTGPARRLARFTGA